MVNYANMTYLELYSLWQSCPNEVLGSVEAEIERRETLASDTDLWLSGGTNHPQANFIV